MLESSDGPDDRRGRRIGRASLLLLGALSLGSLSAAGSPRRLPSFDEPDPSHWINSEPLKASQLEGKVVLLEIWTFG